jgi:hypothetical protein
VLLVKHRLLTPSLAAGGVMCWAVTRSTEHDSAILEERDDVVVLLLFCGPVVAYFVGGVVSFLILSVPFPREALRASFSWARLLCLLPIWALCFR